MFEVFIVVRDVCIVNSGRLDREFLEICCSLVVR